MPPSPQYPLSYSWHLGPTYDDREALLLRADVVEAELEAVGRLLVEANDRGDMRGYEQAAEKHDLACRELVLLRKRVFELGGGG